MGLVTGLSSTASAANYQIIDYNISDITAGGQDHALAYYHVVDAIHRLSYGEPTEERAVTQTTEERGRLIQVRIRDTGGNDLVSIYLWANNLYVAGFYTSRGDQQHYVFDDGRAAEFQRALGIGNSISLRQTGNYSTLPTGNTRESLTINPQAIYNAARNLGTSRGYNDSVGRALVIMIQAFSEAARFGPIFDLVYNNIYHPGNSRQLGIDYAGLENQWGSLSQFARNLRNGQGASINLLGAIVRSFDQLRQRLSFVELNGSIAQL
ncbi:ribosome-inactivating family protein [Streptomyces griseus]|uniref:ribosome-inactivating family protein n=1 Tax=Streptomyces griseus TaxID=1911 RepID=UPI000566AEF2|nr:ribosome-inactivating family protein [Streptomyces griseus]